jgi:phosphonatase-like hydrolase
MSLAGIKLVVFDLGGTTLEDKGLISSVLPSTLREYGIDVSQDDLHPWRGANKSDMIRRLVAADKKGRSLSPDGVYGAYRQSLLAVIGEQCVLPVPGVEAAFSCLRRADIRIALTTGFDRAVVNAILERLGWDGGVVEAIVSADDVAIGRPAPFMVFRAMEKARVLDVRCVVQVGDTVNDLLAGWNAGIAGNIGVLTGAHKWRELARAPHTHILSTAAEVPSLLDLG